MSENMLPFGGTAVADRPAQAQPEVEDSLAGDNRKKLLYVLVGVGVLVLGVVAFFLLKSGGSSAPVASGTVPRGTPHGTAAGGQPAAPAAAAPVTLPRQVKAPEGRDPFKALVVASSAAPSSAPSAAASAPSTGSSTGTTGSTGSTGSTAVSSAPTTHPVWVRLVSVTSSTATFDVGYSNGKTLTVKKFANVKEPKSGSRTIFGTSFALLGISSGKVALQYGDGSPFVMDMTHNYMVVS